MTATFSYEYKRAYTVSTKWNTLVDELISGNEQRKNLWSTPLRKWQLDFEAPPDVTQDIVDFFNARRGKYEAFYWKWLATSPSTGKSLGGDDTTYLVRFDQDELDIKHIAIGYTSFSLKFQEVVS